MANITWDSAFKGPNTTLTNGNLTATTTVAAGNYAYGTKGQSSGKYYFEITPTTAGFLNCLIGLAKPGKSAPTTGTDAAYLTVTSATVLSAQANGVNIITTVAYGTASPVVASGTAIGLAVDLDARLIWFRSAPTAQWNGAMNGNPATGTGGASIATVAAPGILFTPFVVLASTTAGFTANFGSSAFAGTVPSGFTSGFPDTGIPSALTTQAGAEVWASNPSDARFTQIGVEFWRRSVSDLRVTQAGIELWRSNLAGVESRPLAGSLRLTGRTPIPVVRSPVTDPPWANVVLRMPFNTDSLGNDVSPRLHSTAAAGADALPAQKKYGDRSLFIDGAFSFSGILVQDNLADFNFAGQFTIEAWGYCTIAPPGTLTRTLFGNYAPSPLTPCNVFNFGYVNGVLDFRYSTNGTDNNVVPLVSYVPVLNTWVHYAVDRDASGVIRVYADGKVLGKTTDARPFAPTGTLAAPSVGNDQSTIHRWDGWIDDLRVVSGVAVYGSEFSPPAAELPSSAGAGTLTVSIPKGAIVFTGRAPTLNLAADTIPRGGLVITGHPPTVQISAGGGPMFSIIV